MKKIMHTLVLLLICGASFSQIPGWKKFTLAQYHQAQYSNNDVCTPSISLFRYEKIDIDEYFKIHNIWIKFKFNDYSYLVCYDPSYDGKDSIGLYLYKIQGTIVLDSMLIVKCLPELPNGGYGDVIDPKTENFSWINGKIVPIVMTTIPEFISGNISFIGSYGNRLDSDEFGIPYKYKVEYIFTSDDSAFGLKSNVQITDEIYSTDRHQY